MEGIVIERTIFRLANALVTRLARPATDFAVAVEDLILLEAAAAVGLTSGLDKMAAARFREYPGIPRFYHVIVETVLSGLADPRLSTPKFWGEMNRSTVLRTGAEVRRLIVAVAPRGFRARCPPDTCRHPLLQPSFSHTSSLEAAGQRRRFAVPS